MIDSSSIFEGFALGFRWHVFLKIFMEISGMKGVWAPIGLKQTFNVWGPCVVFCKCRGVILVNSYLF